MATLDLSKTKPIPGFDCVKMKREIQAKIYEETKHMTREEEVSVAQAARYLDLADSSIHVLLDNGALKGRQEGDQCWIDLGSLTEYEADCRRMNEGLNEIIRMSEEMGLYDDE